MQEHMQEHMQEYLQEHMQEQACKTNNQCSEGLDRPSVVLNMPVVSMTIYLSIISIYVLSTRTT